MILILEYLLLTSYLIYLLNNMMINAIQVKRTFIKFRSKRLEYFPYDELFVKKISDFAPRNRV